MQIDVFLRRISHLCARVLRLLRNAAPGLAINASIEHPRRSSSAAWILLATSRRVLAGLGQLSSVNSSIDRSKYIQGHGVHSYGIMEYKHTWKATRGSGYLIKRYGAFQNSLARENYSGEYRALRGGQI